MIKNKFFKSALLFLISLIITSGQALIFSEEWTDAPAEEWTDSPAEEWIDNWDEVPPEEVWVDVWVENTEPEPEEVHEPFTAYNFYTGNVYLMNDENYSVILRNVKKSNAFGTEQFVPSLEYIELSIIMDNIFSAAGNKLSFEQINTYLLDQKVEFLVAENQHRVKVVYMEFCK